MARRRRLVVTRVAPNLPPQLSEGTFRVYEPHIDRAVRAWPTETSWSPSAMTDLAGRRLSPHTFVARFRDAVVSLKRFGWDTYIDTAKLRSMSGAHVLAYDADGTVWFRARGRRGRPLEQVAPAPSGASPAPPWAHPSDDELRALCLLLSCGRLVGPFTLSTQVPAETIKALEAEFNVALVWDDAVGVTVVS